MAPHDERSLRGQGETVSRSPHGSGRGAPWDEAGHATRAVAGASAGRERGGPQPGIPAPRDRRPVGGRHTACRWSTHQPGRRSPCRRLEQASRAGAGADETVVAARQQSILGRAGHLLLAPHTCPGFVAAAARLTPALAHRAVLPTLSIGRSPPRSPPARWPLAPNHRHAAIAAEAAGPARLPP